MWKLKGHRRRHSTVDAPTELTPPEDTDANGKDQTVPNRNACHSPRMLFRRSSDGQLHRQRTKQAPLPESPTDANHRNVGVRGSSVPRQTWRRPRGVVRIEHLVAEEIERTINDPGWDDNDDDFDHEFYEGDEHDKTQNYYRNKNDMHENNVITQHHHHSWSASGDSERGRRNRRRRLSLSSLRGLGGPRGGGVGCDSASNVNFRRRGSTSASSKVTWTSIVTTSTLTTRRGQRGGGGGDKGVDDCCINGYSLFGDVDSTATDKYQLATCSWRNSSSTPKGPAVIYAKNYNVTFTPLLTFLGGTFVVLLILRIIVCLLTVATGVIVVFLVVASLVDSLRHPQRNAKWLLTIMHNSPVWVFGGFGGLSGACYCLWVQRRTDEASLVWGLLEGTVFGVELGALWLVVLGDGSEHSLTALWMIRMWKMLCDRVCKDDYHGNNGNPEQKGGKEEDTWSSCRDLDRAIYNDSSVSDDVGEGRRRICMICLGTFCPHEPRQLLPCLHGFHQDCLTHWLRVKKTCPICRVSSTMQYHQEDQVLLQQQEQRRPPPSPSQVQQDSSLAVPDAVGSTFGTFEASDSAH
jgi:Ring finger domain